MISRIHPSERETRARQDEAAGASAAPPRAAVYTVWKRSSMGFQGTDGFSVYDAAGTLAFRLDNYSRRRKLFADRTGHVPSFSIEGSFRRRSCKIGNSYGEEVARINNCAMIMAFVVVLDRICWKPYTPLMCSSSFKP
ncbi:hypothetical protein E2562_025165 [Oryza meyeriana var. granulata]|uniref:Uncharacterized protein n=1 Tax=Oryza meyeriana var. granulata TaxID=110450 RepID=A0A6G1E3R3_9ORYZ|nr:hypothetical protein E2562_025165 [Oryza meyeriana var. granulata]